MFTTPFVTRMNIATLLAVSWLLIPAESSADDRLRPYDDEDAVQVGPRPYYLIDKMSPSPLKRELERCADGPFYKTDFSIGHRGGGTLQFPEHHYQSTLDALTNDGDIMTTLDVLARQVGILGIFSDWSGTVSYYASCTGLH